MAIAFFLGKAKVGGRFEVAAGGRDRTLAVGKPWIWMERLHLR